jgi:hypothetical protein
VESVRVTYELEHPEDPHDIVELHINMTAEGIILDVVSTDEDCDVIGSSSETVDEIATRLLEDS